MLEILILLEFLRNIINSPNILENTNLITPTSNTESIIKEKELSKTDFLKIDEKQISAKSVLIKEFGGATLYAKNPKLKLPIASLTKIMTSLVSFKNYDKKTIFEVPEKFDYYESQVEFSKKEKFERDDLIKAMLISSSNASAILLASEVGIEEFVKKMNETAKSLNLKDTYFEDVTGLSSNNVSTLEDLYALSEYIISNYPEIFEYSRHPSYVLKGKAERILYNTNPLVYKYGKYIIGSKTGFTDEAQQCLIMIIKFENSPIVFIGILGSNDRVKDGEYILKTLNSYYNKK